MIKVKIPTTKEELLIWVGAPTVRTIFQPVWKDEQENKIKGSAQIDTGDKITLSGTAGINLENQEEYYPIPDEIPIFVDINGTRHDTKRGPHNTIMKKTIVASKENGFIEGQQNKITTQFLEKVVEIEL